MAALAAAVPRARGIALPHLSAAEWEALTPSTVATEPWELHRSALEGQRSTFFTKGPHQQLVPEMEDPDAHFEQCKQIQFPMGAGQAESLTKAVEDAAAEPDLRSWRQKAASMVKSIASKCEETSARIRQGCHPAIRQALGKTNLAFIMIMAASLNWPDSELIKDFTEGFTISGRIPNSGVYPTREGQDDADIPWVGEGAQESNLAIHTSMNPPRSEAQHQECDVIRKSYDDLREQGKAGQLMSKETLDKKYGKNGWRSMRRFVIWQNGKARCCDDARRSGHNDAVTVEDRLLLPSAFFPSEAASAWLTADTRLTAEQLESGCEDLKAAYQIIPIAQHQHRWNIIAIWDKSTNAPRYAEVKVALFGTAASVPAYNRVPALLTAFGRRVLRLPMTFYVDDACLVDKKSCKGSGQKLLRTLLEACGWSFGKSQDMSSQTKFLGIEHTFDPDNKMSFWPTEEFCQSILAAIQSAEVSNRLTPGEAAKLRGRTSWMSQATFNKVGRACSAPLAAREFSHLPPWDLNHQLRGSFDFIKAIIETKPKKEVKLGRRKLQPIVVATDGRDARGEGRGSDASLAYLAIDLEDDSKHSGFSNISEEDRLQWEDKKTHIAQIELAAVINFVMRHKHWLAGRDLVVFIDNATALAALVNNTSANQDVRAMSSWLRFTLFQINCNAWFEYVASDANWADSASRGCFKWASTHGWQVKEFDVAGWHQMSANIFADAEQE